MKAIRLEEQSKHFPKQKLYSLTLRGLASQFKRAKLPNGTHSSEKPCGPDCMT